MGLGGRAPAMIWPTSSSPSGEEMRNPVGIAGDIQIVLDHNSPLWMPTSLATEAVSL